MVSQDGTLFFESIGLQIITVKVTAVATEEDLFALSDEQAFEDGQVWQEDLLNYLMRLAGLDIDQFGLPIKSSSQQQALRWMERYRCHDTPDND